MKQVVHIAWFTLVACGSPSERAVEQALREGVEPYRADSFAQAAAIYRPAAFDARVAYDLGNALYQQAQLDTAIKTYNAAISTGTIGQDQAMAYHNLGNSWMRKALEADSMEERSAAQFSAIKIEGDDIGWKVRQFVVRDSLRTAQRQLSHLVDSALTQGSEAYKNALRHAPGDEDTRHNLGLAQRKIAERVKEAVEQSDKDAKKDKEKGLSERAKLIMQKADELVDQYKFTEALKVLQDGLKIDPTLQQQQDYMHKLDVVTKAAEAR